MFADYLGDNPPPRYQPITSRQTCFFVGLDAVACSASEALADLAAEFRYDIVNGSFSESSLEGSIALSEALSCADLAIEFVDSASRPDHYLMGAVRAAFLPRISITTKPKRNFDVRVPSDYHPRLISPGDVSSVRDVIRRELALFEQSSVELDTAQEISRYVELLVSEASSLGEYTKATRNMFVRELNMGDSYKVGQAGAVGPNAHSHDMTFQQVWSEAEQKVDLKTLADELSKLRSALKEQALTSEEDAAIGEIAKAESAAKNNDGPKALAHLKAAGNWALGVAEKIGVGVATSAIKTALGV
ncbi:hypothetical protein [Rhizobium laguerreae]|uniref:hypothetical protein n=1 Tax=Rhizobium laguerreae TaxID=1076926 RepID=UPI0014413C61|nr:hypothetical protein [Rhizobium laguerreae]NKM68575.1 hypothetical protein [Rhizobium laguerreae]